MDSYFNAKPWRPQANELVQLVEEHILARGEPYIVLPHYLDTHTVKKMVAAHKSFASGRCFANQRPGLYTVYQADAFSQDFDRFTQDEALRAAASVFINASSNQYVAAMDIFILMDMSRCKMWPGGTCGGRSSCSAGGWHVDRLARGVKAILYLQDVRGHDGPFSALRGYPKRVDRFGFTAPDLKMCAGYDVEDSSGRHVLRYDTSDIIRKMHEQALHAVEVHAPAGSVILFDISTVHHGKNLLNSSRMSLTNLYEARENTLLTKYPGNDAAARCLRSTEGTTGLDWPFKKLIDRHLGPNPRVKRNAGLSCRDTTHVSPLTHTC